MNISQFKKIAISMTLASALALPGAAMAEESGLPSTHLHSVESASLHKQVQPILAKVKVEIQKCMELSKKNMDFLGELPDGTTSEIGLYSFANDHMSVVASMEVPSLVAYGLGNNATTSNETFQGSINTDDGANTLVCTATLDSAQDGVHPSVKGTVFKAYMANTTDSGTGGAADLGSYLITTDLAIKVNAYASNTIDPVDLATANSLNIFAPWAYNDVAGFTAPALPD